MGSGRNLDNEEGSEHNLDNEEGSEHSLDDETPSEYYLDSDEGSGVTVQEVQETVGQEEAGLVPGLVRDEGETVRWNEWQEVYEVLQEEHRA